HGRDWWLGYVDVAYPAGLTNTLWLGGNDGEEEARMMKYRSSSCTASARQMISLCWAETLASPPAASRSASAAHITRNLNVLLRSSHIVHENPQITECASRESCASRRRRHTCQSRRRAR